MNIILLLIPLAILIALGFLSAFLWSVRQGQLDDLETPAYKILIEDKPVNRKEGQ